MAAVTPDVVIVLVVLGAALVLFLTERVRMDLAALLVLSALAVSGVVGPGDAVAGFSNPAVITVWAMFILSEGLTRAGIADRIGERVGRAAAGSEARLIVILMLVCGFLSAFMNNIGVAALMLPVTVGVAHRSGIAPSRVLLPMAYATLLGGLTTLVGTPPNLLVSTFLEEQGLPGFGVFDFAWVGVPVLLAGTAFVALVGRHLLPRTDISQASRGKDLRALYGLQERIVALRVPAGSLLEGRSLGASALNSAARLMAIALTRSGQTEALPGPDTLLRAGDVLLMQGRLDRFERLRMWSEPVIEREAPELQRLLWEKVRFAELVVAENSLLAGRPILHQEFREEHGAIVLAVQTGGATRLTRLAETPIAAGDRLLVQCDEEGLGALKGAAGFASVEALPEEQVRVSYRLEERLFVLRIPRGAALAGTTVGESQIGDAFDFRLLALFRAGAITPMPPSEETFAEGDLLLIQGREEDLDVLRGLQQFEKLDDVTPYFGVFDRGQLEMVEAALHPHAQVKGRRVADLELRERYQVEVAAVWRDGQPVRTGMGAMDLRRGDALLIVGPRAGLAALTSHTDLIVLNPVKARPVDARKAPLAAALMAGAVGSVLLGWLPIHIAAVAGATLMILTRCLTMEQAYRAIDWRSIFLIAGMLPLGAAMHQTGAAEWLAGGMVSALGGFGPWPVVGGLYAVTALGTLVIPAPALVLLMAPIALSASADLAVSPVTGIMAVAVAAGASLASPVHAANVLVMGPGGYRFADYLRVGVPLSFVVFVVTMLLLPWAWPLQ